MKRSFTKAGSRTVCLGLATLAAVCWSCTKELAWDGDSSPQVKGAIAQARSYYERTATPLTKSIGEQRIAIKPLPGEITPVWSQAKANVLSDGTTSWVDVPIEATITYTAVRGGVHDHEGGEACGHDHSAVQTVQKLTIHTSADGTQQSLITTIVPEPGCMAELRSFSSGTGLTGFSGFVSWHDLTGKLVRVAKYDNGTQTRSVEPTGNNEKEILEVVDDAVLYPEGNGSAFFPLSTKSEWPTKCNYCHKTNCKAPNDGFNHCFVCGQYDPKEKPAESQCICARCTKCGKRFKGDLFIPNTCTCGGKIDKKTCTYCNKLVCVHVLYGADFNDEDKPKFEETVHEEMLQEIFAYSLSTGEFLFVKNGSHLVDKESQNAGDEYLHGMYVPEDNSSRGTALAKMRDHFIRNMGCFVRGKYMVDLGEGFHPILDTYVEMQTRVGMLNYYTYANLNNVVHGMNTAPYVSNPTPCTEAVHYIYDALKALPATATDSEIGAIFDRWVSMAGGSNTPDLLP